MQPKCALAALTMAYALGVVAPCISVAQSNKTRQLKAKSGMSMLDPVGSFAPMLERVIPAVVTVLVTGETLEPVELKPRMSDGSATALPQPAKEPFRSGGSGVIVDAANGRIVTNNHVIADAVRIEVSLWDGRRMPARLVGRDVGTDVAVIEVNDRNLPSVIAGDSDKVRVGDVVLAVGNPFGLESTATLGIVSALMRTSVGHEAFEDFMQIDAPINPGNSGGALVNVRGELIGINTAGPSDPSRASGIGFAIPINMARTIKDEIVANGRMRRGATGLLVEDLTYELMQSLGTRVTRGARIVEVVPKSPADASGFSVGGIITAVSGKPVRSAGEFYTRVATVPVGRSLVVSVLEGEKSRIYDLVTAEIMLPPREVQLPGDTGNLTGAVVGDIWPGNPRFGTLRGAQVLKVPDGTPAYRAGLEPGDIIIGVDSANIRSSEELLRYLTRAGMQFRLRIMRGEVPAWLRVTR